MEQWEYLPIHVEAEAKSKEIKEYLKNQMPDKKRFPRYLSQAMMPELNKLGAEGWELVHMEPVADVGKKGDNYFTGTGSRWSNVYFCVFKRRKPAIAPPTAPTPTQPATTPPPNPTTPPTQE